MQKFILPNLKPYLIKEGVDLSHVVQKARQINEESTPGMRSWSSVVNTSGVGEKTLGKIRTVTPAALKALGKSCPDIVLESKTVEEKNVDKEI